MKFLESIPAKIGVWGVLGNADYSNAKGMCVLCHEHGSKSLRSKSHIKFLRNTAEIIEIVNTEKSDQPLRLAIMGVDDPVTGRAELGMINSHLSEDIPKILLSHSPGIIEEAERLGIDLVLAGHTHGGQLFPVSILLKWLKLADFHNLNYTKGLYQKGDTVMHVNSGIGNSILPFRIGVPPEITVFHFN